MGTRARAGAVVSTAVDERRNLTELAAMQRELTQSVTRLIDFHVTQMNQTPDEALAGHRRPLAIDPAEREPDQIAWWELERTLETDPANGQALWQAIKDAASKEFATGTRMARTLERGPLTASPYQRAQALVLLTAFRKALQPRDALEDALVQQLASAYELHLRWQAVAVERAEDGVWEGAAGKRRELEHMSARERQRYEDLEGWLPPRVSTAEAIEQAVLLADRYQRAFIRLLKAFRDMRRLIGQVIVTEGGTLNVAEQQVNLQHG